MATGCRSPSADARCARRFALVDQHFKYIYTPRDELQLLSRSHRSFMGPSCRKGCKQLPEIEELFDLEADPFEQDNLLLPDELDPSVESVRLRFREALAVHLDLPRQYVRGVRGEGATAASPELEESTTSARLRR